MFLPRSMQQKLGDPQQDDGDLTCSLQPQRWTPDLVPPRALSLPYLFTSRESGYNKMVQPPQHRTCLALIVVP
jgi:hypothetical protein